MWSTARIKNFKSTRAVINLPGRDMSVFCPINSKEDDEFLQGPWLEICKKAIFWGRHAYNFNLQPNSSAVHPSVWKSCLDKSLFLSSNHKQKCLEFTIHYWNFELNKVGWANKGFVLSNTQGRVVYPEENLILAVTYGGVSGNLVGVMDPKYHGRKSGYLGQKDRASLWSDLPAGQRFSTYLDPHTNGSVTTMFLTWQSQVPDWSSTGNLWNELKRSVHKSGSCRDLVSLRFLDLCSQISCSIVGKKKHFCWSRGSQNAGKIQN